MKFRQSSCERAYLGNRGGLVIALATATLLASGGCATIEKDNAQQSERTLAAAGFQMKFAKAPEQIEKVESLPQRTLTPSPGPDGKNRFVYADAASSRGSGAP